MPNSEYLLVLEHSCQKHMDASEWRRAWEVKQVANWQAANREMICGTLENGEEYLADAEAARAATGEAWGCRPLDPGTPWSSALLEMGGEAPTGAGRDPLFLGVQVDRTCILRRAPQKTRIRGLIRNAS